MHNTIIIKMQGFHPMLYFIKTDNKNGPENEPAAYDI